MIERLTAILKQNIDTISVSHSEQFEDMPLLYNSASSIQVFSNLWNRWNEGTRYEHCGMIQLSLIETSHTR